MTKTSMPNPVESIAHIKCYSVVAPDALKTLAILSDTTDRRFALDWEHLKPYEKLGKTKFLEVISYPIISKY